MSVAYVYEANPSSGETLLAGGESSFFASLFDEAKNRLARLKSLRYEEETCLFLPSNEEEDANQSRRRQAFRLGEWILPAMVVNLDGEPIHYLLIDRSSHSHAYVVDAKTLLIEVICLRGISVREDQEALGIDLFLDSLKTEEELSAPVSFEPSRKAPIVDFSFTDSDEDEEIFDLEVIRPAFTANSKKAIRNLGNGMKPILEEEEDDEDLDISVERPAFTANRQGKIRNLDERRPSKKPIVLPKKKEEDEEEDLLPSKPFVVEKSAFVPSSNKKPRQIRDEKPVRKPQKPTSSKPQSASLEIQEAKPQPPLDAKPNSSPKVEEAKASSPARTEEKPVDPKKNWIAVSEFIYGPSSSARGSLILIDDPNDAPVHEEIRKNAKELSKFGKPHWSSRCAFCPAVLAEGDPHLETIASFREEDWTVWAENQYLGHDPISYLCCNKKDPRFFLVVSIVSGELIISGVSTDGASISDPKTSFLELRGIVHGHARKINAAPREDRLLLKSKKAIASMESNLANWTVNPEKIPARLKKEILLVRGELAKIKKHLSYSSSPEKTQEIMSEYDLSALSSWVDQICFELEQGKALREGN